MVTWLKRNGAASLGLVGLVFLVYSPLLHGQLVWDDYLLIGSNPLVTGKLDLGSVWFQTAFPLSIVAFWLQWLVWGSHPIPFHVVNILFHALNAVLVWRLLSRLLVGRESPRADSSMALPHQTIPSLSSAWLGAAFFAVHPVCVATVGWISELKNTMSLLFFLLSFLWYLQFEEEEEKRAAGMTDAHRGAGPTSLYLRSLAAFALSLLSKTSTVVLPLLLLATAWWRRRGLRRGDWLKTIPYFTLSIIFGLMTIWSQQRDAIKGATVQVEGFWGRLAGAGWAVWFYLGKALAPVNLSFIYPRWAIDAHSAWSYLPLVLLAGVFVLGWHYRSGWGRHLLFGLGCYVIALLPVLGFLDMYYLAISRVSDHFQYLALIAVTATAAAGLGYLASVGRAYPRAEASVTVLAVVIIAGLSLAAFQRARVFATEEGLYRDTLARNPAAWPLSNDLGCILVGRHEYAAAWEQFEQSLRFNPRNTGALLNLGRLLALMGDPSGAEAQYVAALKLNPLNVEAQKCYASALLNRGRAHDALTYLRAALQAAPDADTRIQYAAALYQLGDPRGAVAQFRLVLSANPDSPEALNDLAWLLATSPDPGLRRGPEAVMLAERACRLTHDQSCSMLMTLSAAYAETGRFGDAVATGEKVQQLALQANNQRLAAVNSQLLMFYRSGKPYHGQ